LSRRVAAFLSDRQSASELKTCTQKSEKWDSCSQPSSNSPAGVPRMWGMGNLNELG
jgi:hypothetical protein